MEQDQSGVREIKRVPELDSAQGPRASDLAFARSRARPSERTRFSSRNTVDLSKRRAPNELMASLRLYYANRALCKMSVGAIFKRLRE